MSDDLTGALEQITADFALSEACAEALSVLLSQATAATGSLPDTPPPRLTRRVRAPLPARYTDRGLIGEGGMGQVRRVFFHHGFNLCTEILCHLGKTSGRGARPEAGPVHLVNAGLRWFGSHRAQRRICYGC